jgi:hypothetical protein
MGEWKFLENRAFELGISSCKNMIVKDYAGFPDKLVSVYTFELRFGFWKIQYKREK